MEDNQYYGKVSDVGNGETVSYVVSGLSANTTYTVYVEAVDKAGNVKATKASISVTTDKKGLEIGDYIDYTPTYGTFTASSTYSGYSADQDFETNTDLKWRILATDSDTLTLISQDVANESFYLKGYQGYNNGVLLLNDACKAMYSNSRLGATARSIKIEDIEAVSTFDKTSYVANNGTYAYGDIIILNGSSNRCYPQIFALETTGYVDGVQGTTYSSGSQQSSYILQTSKLESSKSTTITMTSYNYQMLSTYMSTIYSALFTCQPGNSSSTNHTSYWLASRCVQQYRSVLLTQCYFEVCELCHNLRFDELL